MKPSFKRRLANWDYRQRAIYAITLELANRREPVLGRLLPGLVEAVRERGGVGRGEWEELWRTRQSTEPAGAAVGFGAGARAPRGVQRGIGLTGLGAEVAEMWAKLGEKWPGVAPLDCQVMGEHFHGVIFVKTRQAKTLGNIIGSFKSMTASRAKALLGEGFALWAEGYVDKVILRRGQLESELEYLRDNPRRRAVKLAFPELFRVVSEIRAPLWRTRQSTEPAGVAVAGRQSAGLAGTVGREGAAVGRQSTEPAGAEGFGAGALAPWGFGRFMALGNRFLLERPLQQVQVSRSFFRYRRDSRGRIVRDDDGLPQAELASPEFAERRDELFALAKHGIAMISPCVSDGEREIARLALEARLPLVTLQNKGFSPLAKPGGRYFEACADGLLLMLAPTAWPYQPGEKKMTRFDAAAMNRLAQWLAGAGAAEINYHGMKPTNIDELACAAACVGS